MKRLDEFDVGVGLGNVFAAFDPPFYEGQAITATHELKIDARK